MPRAPYRRTPSFTAETTPEGLKRRHSTKAGTWGRIVIERGALIFRKLDESGVIEEQLLREGQEVWVAPQEPHEVAPQAGVRFYVEFCRDVPD